MLTEQSIVRGWKAFVGKRRFVLASSTKFANSTRSSWKVVKTCRAVASWASLSNRCEKSDIKRGICAPVPPPQPGCPQLRSGGVKRQGTHRGRAFAPVFSIVTQIEKFESA